MANQSVRLFHQGWLARMRCTSGYRKCEHNISRNPSHFSSWAFLPRQLQTPSRIEGNAPQSTTKKFRLQSLLFLLFIRKFGSMSTEATRGPDGLDTPMASPPASHLGPHQWTRYHQYQQVHLAPDDQRVPSPVSSTHSVMRRSVSPISILNEPPVTTKPTDALMAWRPAYLRRVVIVAFIIIFAIILVAVEVLFAFSDRNYGIGTGNPGQHYLWTYGPTAFLIVIAAVWSRVDYQSKMVTPWISLSTDAAHRKKPLLQDYISDFVPFSIFKALRRKDFLVAITSTVSILIKILIVISTGLITLSWITVKNESYPMSLQDQFVDDDSRLEFTSALPFYMMKGFADNNLSYPDGLYNGFAFQSLKPDLPASAQTRIETDGFRSFLDCEPANINLTWAQPRNPHYANSTYMNFTASAETCNVRRGAAYSPPWRCGSEDECTTAFSRFTEVKCDDAADDDDSAKRMMIVVGELTFTIDYSRNMSDYTGVSIIHPYLSELKKSTQMLCIPRYFMGRLEVIRNGTETRSVTPIGSWNTTLSSVSPWSIIAAQDAAALQSLFVGGTTNTVSGAGITLADDFLDTDAALRLAFLSKANEIAVSSLYDADRLHGIVEEYYGEFSAIIAKQSLMQPASLSIMGIAEVNGNRLVVRSGASQWMAGLLAACILLATVALFLVPKQGFLPRNPSSISGTAALIQHSRDLLARLRYAGLADDKGLGNLLSTAVFTSEIQQKAGQGPAHYTITDMSRTSEVTTPGASSIRSPSSHPVVVHPGTRIGLSLILVGLVVALELLLRKSADEDGLGDVEDDTYIHYTWTTIPAIIFGVLAMVFSSMDFTMRALAPYVALKRTVEAHKLINMEFLDMSLPRTMIREVKSGGFGPLSSTLAFLVTSLFTIFSASLFHPTFIEVTGSVDIRMNQSFSADYLTARDALLAGDADLQIASLILAGNLSYPRFTYEDLAFPEFVPTDIAMPDGFAFNASSIPIHVVVPALRPRLECRSYTSSDMQLNLTMNDTMPSVDYPNTIGVLIDGEAECRIDRDSRYEEYRYNAWIEMTTVDPTLFGECGQAQNSPDIEGCSEYLYIWGRADGNSDPVVQHIAAMGCNTTWEAVDVNVTFVGTNLDLDPEHPPAPLEHTARPSTANAVRGFSSPQDYSGLPGATLGPNAVLDKFFNMLTVSRWAIPQSSLGDRSADDSIREAIKWQSKILQTQKIAYRRVVANETNSTIADPQPGETDDQFVFKATMTEAQGRHRVVQDTVSTRILQALLGITLVLLLLGWFFMHDTAILATSPTSIASVSALISGGNIVELLPEDAASRSREEIEAAIGRRTRFWLGWSTLPEDEVQTSGAESEGEQARFGIFALREENQKSEYVGAGRPEDDTR